MASNLVEKKYVPAQRSKKNKIWGAIDIVKNCNTKLHNVQHLLVIVLLTMA
jgi:hypothetical protein